MNTNATRKLNVTALGALIKKSPEFKLFVPGEIVDAILIEKAQKAAYFNLGPFGTGIVFGAEFSNASNILKSLNPGDPISAKVTSTEGENGYVELSLAEAGLQKSWEVIKELEERGEIISVKISGANAGGLLTELQGVRAFIPVSQLSEEHYPRVDDGDRTKIMEELKKFVGTDLKVKIIDMKPRAKKLILSERENSDAGNAKELLEKYEVGQTIEGVISGVADFGAFIKFVDNPQIEGLVHISELDHKLIESPKEVVKIGDAVQAKIIEIKEGKVSLSLKALKPDPWLKVADRYKAGMEVQGTITRFNPFGAFVSLDAEIQGLIHVSEFGSVEEMKGRIEIGKTYSFSIELVKPEEKRIILKLKK